MRQEHTPRHIRKLSTKYQENTCKTSAPMVSFPIHKVWEPKGTQTFLALFWACSQEASHPLLTTTWGLQILPRCYKISSKQKRVALGLVYLRILLLLCLICTSLYTSVWKRFRHPTISGGGKKTKQGHSLFYTPVSPINWRMGLIKLDRNDHAGTSALMKSFFYHPGKVPIDPALNS